MLAHLKRFFALKRPDLARNWHFCPLQAHLVPCFSGLAGGCGAGCNSQDTYLLYSTYASASVGVSAGVIGTIGGCESTYAHGPRRHPLSVRQCLSLHKDSQSLL